jgi:transposase
MERKDPVTLSQKEQRRLRLINDLSVGRRSVAEVTQLLGLSQRQVRRLKAGFEQHGAAALAHGNRGRPSQHRLSDELRGQIVDLAAGPYAACNDSHLRELLALREGILVSRATIQRLRRRAGQKPKQRRRPPQHRRRRDRMPQEGMLLQVDGSPHHWLGEDRPRLCLLGAIDDATGKVVASLFREQEDAQGYFLLLKQVLKRQGIPLDLYHDRHSIFQVNPRTARSIEDQLAAEPEATQFGRALNELGIGAIAAHSPEAKGRVERLWRTLQDRLVAEMELASVTDIKAANRFLPGYLERLNARFAVQAEEPGLAYRPLGPDLDLERILSFRYQRVVARDNTVRLGGRLVQIPAGPARRSYFKARVWVHEFLDGALGVWYQDRWLVRLKAGQDSRVRARKRTPVQPERAPLIDLQPSLPKPASATAGKPTAPHPWRRFNPGYLGQRRTESRSS